MSNGEDEGHQVTYCCSDDMLNQFLSIFGSASPISAQKAIGVPSCSSYENIMSHGVHKGEATGTTTKFATNSTGIQERESDEDDTPKDDCKADGECRPQKRRRSAEIHNLTERLRRQRFKEKMRSLQQLIPNCNKRDKASTLDDAINYIKNLQYQLQMVSMGAGFTMFHSPWTATSLQQGTQIPSLPPYQQTRPNPGMGYGNGIGSGIDPSGVNFPTNHIGLHSKHCPLPSNSQLGYGIGIRSGIELGLSSVNIPMNQIGSHSKHCSLPSGSQLGQGGVSELRSFQNAGDVSEHLTCNPLDYIIGQYARLVHNEAPSTSSSRRDMGELPHIPPFSEASESFP